MIFRRCSIVSVFLFLILTISACNSSSVKTDESVEDGLIISSIVTGLGGDPDTTVVSYNFNLLNRTDKSFMIKTVEPVLTADLQNRLTDNNIKLEINKQLNENSSEAIFSRITEET